MGAETSGRSGTVGLSAGIERAWGRRPSPRKGPKPGLDLDGIVAAGVSLAQSDGLGAVSMSRVAAALGVSTMALYSYLDSKDELLALMVDHACGKPPGHLAGKGWRRNLAQWAATLFDGYLRHPWAAHIPMSRVPPTPTQIAWLEAGLRCLAGTELTDQQRLSTVLLLGVFVRSEASLARDLSPPVEPGANDTASRASYGQLLRQLIDPQRFPEVSAVAAIGAFDDQAGIDEELSYGLERILDGIEHLLQRDRIATSDKRDMKARQRRPR